MITNTEASLMGILEHCHELAMLTKVPENEQPGVIGYFPVYFPEELVHAAGLRPYAIYVEGANSKCAWQMHA